MCNKVHIFCSECGKDSFLRPRDIRKRKFPRLCNKCSRRGKNSYNWKGGFPNCKKCDKKLTQRHYTFCSSCVPKKGKINPNYKGICDRKCITCSNSISADSQSRCRSCNIKYLRGEKHPRYKGGKDYLYRKNQEYQKDRLKTDVNFKLRKVLRSRLSAVLKGKVKRGSAVRDLGCSIEDLRVFLENQFQSGMTWDNHGKWHIDHIRPLASFDLTDEQDLLKACHYTNLQPLWAKDNLQKSDKWIEE